jgi:mannosyltransferase OCH1-like enzyme
LHDAPPRIPHTLHFIWLGSEVPDWVQRNISSWQAHHPSWEVRLWRDDDAAAFPLANRQAFDAARNFGEKSDILRYEVMGCCHACSTEGSLGALLLIRPTPR